MLHFLVFLASTCLLSIAVELPECTFESCPVCLPEAKNTTKNIDVYVNQELLSLPLRIGQCLAFWDSQAVVANMVGILAKEKIGFNIEYVDFEADMAGFYGVHNCRSWQTSDCPKVVRSVEEASIAYNASEKLNKDAAPDIMFVPEVGKGVLFSPAWNDHTDIVFLAAQARIFGPSGFVARVYFFIYPEIFEHAWTQDNFALDSYQAYASSKAGRYFNTVQELIDSGLIKHEFAGCDFSNHVSYASYAADLTRWGWTCVEDGWWLTPACSQYGSSWKQECIPLLDDSWSYPKPSELNAVASLGLRFAKVTLGYDLFWELIYYKEVSAPFFWWYFDAQFAALNPIKVNMPAAYESSQMVLVENMGWQPVLDVDEQLAHLLTHVNVDSTLMDELMQASAAAQDLDYWADHETGPQLFQKLACEFLRKHRSVWETSWLPDPRSCAAGSFYDESISLCQPCPYGTYSYRNLNDGIPRCSPCPLGHFCGEKSSKPEECPRGYFAASLGMGECTSCSKGRYQNQTGQTSCIACKERTTTLPDSNRIQEADCACDLGSYGIGQDCSPCPANSATSAIASQAVSACLCAPNTYMTWTFICLTCPFGSETKGGGKTNLSSCLCEKGMFLPYAGSACADCPQGFICPPGSTAHNFARELPSHAEQSFPLLEPGYWTYYSKPLDVYKCATQQACAGGLSETCAGGHKGFLCTECSSGHFSNGEECMVCSLIQKATPIIAFVVLLLVSIMIYYLGNDPQPPKPPPRLLLGVLVGMLVTNGQVLGTFSQLNVPWPSSVKGFFEFAAVLVFEPDKFSAECLFGFDPTLHYALRFMLPIWVVVQYALIYVIFRILGFVKPAIAWSLDKTTNSLGVVFQIAFIALCGFVAVPLQCYSHPNGLTSVTAYPSIICNSKEQVPLIIMSMITLTVFVIPYLAIAMLATRYVVKDHIGKYKLFVRCRFLVYRFRPDVWWWGIVFTARQTLLAFAPVVHPDDPAMQVFYVALILTTYLCFLCNFSPWISPGLNIFDAFSAVMLLLVVVLVSSFLPVSRWPGHHSEMTRVLVGLLFTSGCLCMGGVVFFITCPREAVRRAKMEKLCEDLQRFGKFMSTLDDDDVHELVDKMNFFDRSNLNASMALWQAAVGLQFQIAESLPPRLYHVTKKKSISEIGQEVKRQEEERKRRRTSSMSTTSQSTGVHSSVACSDISGLREEASRSHQADCDNSESIVASCSSDLDISKSLMWL